jgi:hypothetical protein
MIKGSFEFLYIHYKKIFLKMCICKRCSDIYSIDNISKKYIEKNVDRYKLCSNCRKYNICKNCNNEFHHKQNQTCSINCARELKEKSFMMSCNTKHNFSKNSKSRINWENNLLKNEGIINIFQREDVKKKIKETILEKYGVDSISKSNIIKLKKKETLKRTIELNPKLYFDIWHNTHDKFIKEIGYDPRLHLFGKASKESLKVFNPLIEWCLSVGIEYDDIFIGIDDKNEYFIKDDNIHFYDFVIKNKKIIIEFNGVAFHARPEQLNKNEWFNPFTKENAEDNIKRSKIKYQLAIDRGFEILEIWSDICYLDNIELCKKFIIGRI